MPGLEILAVGDLGSVAPEIVLSLCGIAVLLCGAFWPRLDIRVHCFLAAAGVLAAAYLSWSRGAAAVSFGGLLESSPISSAIGQVLLLVALLSLLASPAYLRRERIGGGEFPALLLWATVGGLLLVRATELITLFLALEILSLALYSLAGLPHRLSLATEAAIKYFLMGAFVSAFFLYGIALLYGRTGSTRLAEVGTQALEGDPIVVLGLLLLAAGVGFKMSIVPFHAWAPDAYQGAPTPFVAYLSVVPKAAGAMILLRLLELASELDSGPGWSEALALLAVASMIVGNLFALVQKDIKRMLAYSGIGHMGFLLIPMVTMGPDSYPAVIVYLVAYALMNVGAFAVVGLLYARANEQHLIGELAGWGYRFPFLGLALTLCLLSLAGIPPTAGFLGKYMVFLHALRHDHPALALIGIAASLVGVVYYLRVVYVLYMKPEVVEPEGLRIDSAGRLAVLLAAGGTLLLGIFPGRLLNWLGEIAAGMT